MKKLVLKIALCAILFVGIVIGGVSSLRYLDNNKSTGMANPNSRPVTTEKTAVVMSDIQLAIADEVFDYIEDNLYNQIVELDNSENFNNLESDIIHKLNSMIDKKQAEKIVKILGKQKAEEIQMSAYHKIRTKVDKSYDDEYIEEIVDYVIPKLEQYRREIVRRAVLDSIYSRVNDNVIEQVSEEIIDEVRVTIANFLKNKALEDINNTFGLNLEYEATPALYSETKKQNNKRHD